MVADNQMLHQHPQLGREIGQLLKLVMQHAQTDHDVTQQLAFGAVTEAALVGQLSHLADVVQYRAGESNKSGSTLP